MPPQVDVDQPPRTRPGDTITRPSGREQIAAAQQVSGLPDEACFLGPEASTETSHIEEALAAYECDVVIVVTPPPMHAVQCRAAIAAGKHVYVEKPFCKDLAEAAQIVAEAEAAGVKLMVSQNARLLYGLPPLVELARSGDLGEITAGLMVKTMHRGSVHNSGEDDHSYLWEHGVHDFDSMRFVFGSEPKRVFCDSYNPPWSPYKGGAGTMAWVEFESGARCQFYCSFMTPNNGAKTALEELTGGIYWRLDFERGTAEYTDGTWKIHRPGQDEPEDTGFSDSTGIPGHVVSSAESVLLDLFHDYLFKDIEPEQSGRKNLNTVGLITALGHSSERGQPIDFADYLAEHTSVLEEVSETARL